jgi:toluene methyl-monooxygenase electron transfer component
MLAWFKRKPADDGLCRVRVQGTGQTFTVPRDTFLLGGALAQGLAYPHNCRVGTCGECRTRLVEGKVKPMIDFALSPLTADELKAGCILACQSKVRGDLVIDVELGARPAPAVVTRQATVAQADVLPGDVLSLRLALDAPLHFEAGQYADLSIAGSDAVRSCSRSYSFCDTPAAGGLREVSFLVKRLPGGRFSERLFSLARPGLAMQLQGPFGQMGVADADAHAVCVAGGTGLAPMLSILGDRLARSQRARYTLLVGLRSQRDHFAGQLLDALMQRAGGRIDVRVVLSDEPAGSPWPGARGLVTEVLAEALAEAAAQGRPATAAFLCGGEAMVHAARARLIELGLAAEAIHADAFAPSGAAAKAA